MATFDESNFGMSEGHDPLHKRVGADPNYDLGFVGQGESGVPMELPPEAETLMAPCGSDF